uniref:Uncharacterized protein n=1 Tax=Arundo donax TaxID=35708 RepID=A0A0A8Z8X0_ARUDO
MCDWVGANSSFFKKNWCTMFSFFVAKRTKIYLTWHAWLAFSANLL